MTKIDTTWAVCEIDAFLHATDQIGVDMGPGITYLGTTQRMPQTESAQRAHVVEQILDRVIPAWRHIPIPDKDKEWTHLRDWASRARVTLEREDELREHLGDGAPEMDAGQLHPWAWENAASLWRTGHYAQAVTQAAIRVNAETQAKVGRRDISETDLFKQVFSLDDPKPGAPRLRRMKDDGSKTYSNMHRGAWCFADGIYAAIRNVGSHEIVGDLDEQRALEYLASFSILARWVDDADVVHAAR